MLVECKCDGFLAARRDGMGNLTGQDRLTCLTGLLMMVHTRSPGEGAWAEESSSI